MDLTGPGTCTLQTPEPCLPSDGAVHPRPNCVCPWYVRQGASCARPSECVIGALGHNRLYCHLRTLATDPQHSEWEAQRVEAGHPNHNGITETASHTTPGVLADICRSTALNEVLNPFGSHTLRVLERPHQGQKRAMVVTRQIPSGIRRSAAKSHSCISLGPGRGKTYGCFWRGLAGLVLFGPEHNPCALRTTGWVQHCTAKGGGGLGALGEGASPAPAPAPAPAPPAWTHQSIVPMAKQMIGTYAQTEHHILSFAGPIRSNGNQSQDHEQRCPTQTIATRQCRPLHCAEIRCRPGQPYS